MNSQPDPAPPRTICGGLLYQGGTHLVLAANGDEAAAVIRWVMAAAAREGRAAARTEPGNVIEGPADLLIWNKFDQPAVGGDDGFLFSRAPAEHFAALARRAQGGAVLALAPSDGDNGRGHPALVAAADLAWAVTADAALTVRRVKDRHGLMPQLRGLGDGDDRPELAPLPPGGFARACKCLSSGTWQTASADGHDQDDCPFAGDSSLVIRGRRHAVSVLHDALTLLTAEPGPDAARRAGEMCRDAAMYCAELVVRIDGARPASDAEAALIGQLLAAHGFARFTAAGTGYRPGFHIGGSAGEVLVEVLSGEVLTDEVRRARCDELLNAYADAIRNLGMGCQVTSRMVVIPRPNVTEWARLRDQP